MTIYPQLPRPFFVLAPMYNVADTVFRQIIAEFAAPDLFMTEFVNVDGLQSSGRSSVINHLKFSPKEQPIIAQIWGRDPANYYKSAHELVRMGFSGIDINMGCPDKAVIKNRCCSALIQNREEAVAIIAATIEGAGGNIPVSVKTRLGFGSIDYTWHELLLQQNLSMLSIHGRTAKQMSRGAADWEAIGNIRRLRDKIAPHTLLVGNGDVNSRQEGLDLVERYGVDGVMIGRGIFQDPFIFAADSPWGSYSRSQRIELFMKHVKLFAETWQQQERRLETLNKFCKVYISGFDGALEMRESLMHSESIDELQEFLVNTLKKDMAPRA